MKDLCLCSPKTNFCPDEDFQAFNFFLKIENAINVHFKLGIRKRMERKNVTEICFGRGLSVNLW